MTMRAAVIRMQDGLKVLRTEQFPLPQPGPGEVLVRVSHAGICGSDVHGFQDAVGTARREGLIMSHEVSGHVAAFGEGVAGLVEGHPVTVDPQVVCGECLPCRNGWISICDRKGVIGSSLRGFVQGGMAEYVAVAAGQVHPVPDSVPLAAASVIEPLANALHVVRRAAIVPGETVLLLGAGPLGLCILQCLKAAGAGTVIVTDLSASRRALAMELGADVALSPSEHDIAQEIAARTGGAGADVVVESVGIDITYQQAVAAVRKRGRIMFFGAVQDTVTLPLLPILHKEITIIGCTGANDETAEAIELVASGRVRVEPMITHQFPLEQAQEAMAVLSVRGSDAIKVQLVP